VRVTHLSDGAVVPLEAVAEPVSFCKGAKWMVTLYRFEVTQPGLYQVGGQLQADPGRLVDDRPQTLVILRTPFLTGLVNIYSLAITLAPRLTFLAVVCFLPAGLTALVAWLRGERGSAEPAPQR
jgi:hypothetical protein